MAVGKVLVLGDDTRSFLAIVRSLGRAGIEVHAAPEDFTAPALASTYISQTHYLPYWAAGDTEWLAAFETLLRAEHFDLVIPCSETTLLPLQHHRLQLEALTRIAIPSDEAISVLFDKHETRELAKRLGIPVAPGCLAQPSDIAADIFALLGAPVIVKPRRSYTLGNLGRRGRVIVAQTEQELAAILPEVTAGEVLYEGFFPGRGVGVSVLASKGRVLQAFEHHRVRETLSGSYYRVSAPLTPALEQCCTAMVGALNYTGVAMFEFRQGDQPDHWILLEVNARPWGSMPLPVSLGVDFPYRWYRLLVDGADTPPVAYPVGVFGRNLIPDFRATLSELKSVRSRPLHALFLGVSRVFELHRGLTGRDKNDSWVRDDPRPALQEGRRLVSDVAARITLLNRRSIARERSNSLKSLHKIVRQPDGSPLHILFVCQGNICRSPFAAALLQHRLAGRLPSIRVGSYGMLPRPGRATPAFGVEAAAAVGIDLSGHRSAHLSLDEAMAATAIFIFDDINRRAIQQRYPSLTAPVLTLGHFAPPSSGINDIADPIDCSLSYYIEIYKSIEISVEGLIGELINQLKP